MGTKSPHNHVRGEPPDTAIVAGMVRPWGDRLARTGDTIMVGGQGPVILLPPLLGMRRAASLSPSLHFKID